MGERVAELAGRSHLIVSMLHPRKPLLIVPIRDRRQRRRILTIRNCALSMLTVAVIFAAFSIRNEARRGSGGDYGRLFGTQVAAPKGGITRTVDVVKEGPVADQAAADPMLVAPAAREQILRANTNAPAPVPTTAITLAAPAQPRVIQQGEGHGMAIVGDDTGVTVVHATTTSTAPPPVLAGGIFKQ
jgi:hypothetical protein